MQNCPICNTNVQVSERYPDYICLDCVKRAKTEDGRKIEFSNIDASGGYQAHVKFLNIVAFAYDSHECFIDGVKCYANEAYMGGIVVRPFKEPLLKKVF